jgi:hypothetical protein
MISKNDQRKLALDPIYAKSFDKNEVFVAMNDIFLSLDNKGNKKYNEYIPKNSLVIAREDMGKDMFTAFCAKNVFHGAIPLYDAAPIKPYIRKINKDERLNILNIRIAQKIKELEELDKRTQKLLKV